ncbi:MAG: glycosyltransferase [Opitutae bacterium]|nr:glycosyltransferase [Opitutae bacterium]
MNSSPNPLTQQVSVVLPTLNRLHLLRRALYSVQAQTLPPLETIVIDDGSTDRSHESLATEFPTVQWIRQSNHGVSHARNQGIKQAKGEWIALLDSDDTWHPSKLEEQNQFLQQNLGLLFCHTDEAWMRRGKSVSHPAYLNKSNQDIFLKSLARCIICPSSVVIHQKIFEKIGFFDEELPVCEDYDLWLRLVLQYEIGYLDRKLVTKHGGHSDQLSTTYWGMDRFRVQSLQKLLDNPNLKSSLIPLIFQTLIQKLDILNKGFSKRDKQLEAKEFNQLKQFYSHQLAKHTKTLVPS